MAGKVGKSSQASCCIEALGRGNLLCEWFSGCLPRGSSGGSSQGPWGMGWGGIVCEGPTGPRYHQPSASAAASAKEAVPLAAENSKESLNLDESKIILPFTNLSIISISFGCEYRQQITVLFSNVCVCLTNKNH